MTFREWVTERRYSIADFSALVLILGLVDIATTVIATIIQAVIN